MNTKVPQSVVLHALLSELRKDCPNVSGDDLFVDLNVAVEVPESIRYYFSFDILLPDLPDKIIQRISTFNEFQDFGIYNDSCVDVNLTVRNLSVSITLWYMEHHKDYILSLTFN